MSWNDFYKRRDIMDAVLRGARRDPRGGLPFAEVAGAVEMFGTEENLLLALHHKWTQVLDGYLRVTLGAPDDAERGKGWDAMDAVRTAWRSAAEEHATLRSVLDAGIERYQGKLAEMHRSELRTIAIASEMVGVSESGEEITQVGATVLALIRSNPAPTARRRRGPVGGLLRRLAPAG